MFNFYYLLEIIFCVLKILFRIQSDSNINSLNTKYTCLFGQDWIKVSLTIHGLSSLRIARRDSRREYSLLKFKTKPFEFGEGPPPNKDHRRIERFPIFPLQMTDVTQQNKCPAYRGLRLFKYLYCLYYGTFPIRVGFKETFDDIQIKDKWQMRNKYKNLWTKKF